MVEIRAFRALRYAPSFHGSYAQLLAPPYDVIGACELQRLWDRSPYNIVRLILPAGNLPPGERECGYQLAAERLADWKEEGVLVADPQPALYLYRQRFQLASGVSRSRLGFFALVRLSEWGEGIYRHELTLPGPVSDRIHLLESCQANLSSIFGLYSDPEGAAISPLLEGAEGHPPTVEAVDDHGIWHGLWPLSDPSLLRRVADHLRERAIVVADGHHRYTAALEYRNRRRAQADKTCTPAPWDYVLFYLTALEDPGLIILPTHQVLHHLPDFNVEGFVSLMAQRFTVQEQPALAVLLEQMELLAAAPEIVIGIVLRGSRYYLLRAPRPTTAAEEALDVAILRRWAVEPLLAENGSAASVEAHLRYTHESAEAAAWVSAGEADVAFILRPTPLERVRTLALERKVMPQKSTYFWPKVLSGLVIHDFAQWQPERPF